MKPLRLLVTYTAKSGQRDAFLRAVLQSGVPETVLLPDGFRQEDGCLRYDYFLSAERPDEILLIEEWASAEQQQTHLRQPHMQQLKQQKAQYIAETDVQTL